MDEAGVVKWDRWENGQYVATKVPLTVNQLKKGGVGARDISFESL